MISVDAALAHLFTLVAPLGTEHVNLQNAFGRVLAHPQRAQRDQPPFAASAMDGYAVLGAAAIPGAVFTVIGESAAGHRWDGALGPGEAVRIFTGAPVPNGADRIIIQEDVQRQGNQITLSGTLDKQFYIRPAGNDFLKGQQFDAPKVLNAQDVALLASMNVAQVPVAIRPSVALVSTGDELVMPGDIPGADQIIVSNTFGLQAQLTALGAAPRILPIARDSRESLHTALELAADADLIITIGGASVGDHDLVGQVAADMGLNREFHKVAMRPGKPLMGGRLGTAAMIGLPGNPVSAMVCGHVFVAPVVRKMLGLPAMRAPTVPAVLEADVPANGAREHYMRAVLCNGTISALSRQDSALLSVLSQANALLIRPPHDGARVAGETVQVMPL